MTDWLDEFRAETEKIRKKTEQLRTENKILKKQNNNLKSLSHEKLSKIVAKCTKMNTVTNPYTGDSVEKPFYRFFAIDYYEAGAGRSIYLQISLNSNNEHYEEEWKHFVNYEFYLQGAEELEEREFLDRYTRLLPDMIAHMLREKSLTIWQQHLHFNRN